MKSNDTKNILLVGVGGQGTILASKLLSEGLVRCGYDVKMSEIHGMSQRGGSVTTHVRYGTKVASPVVPLGCADILVAFEKIEAVRWLAYLKKEGTLVVNDYELYSLPVLTGAAEYPEGVTEKLKSAVKNTKCIKAAEIASSLGNIKAQNVVLTGALAKSMNLGHIDWKSVLTDIIPSKMLELNIKAFETGYAL
ncbi:MAG: indolepyruvate oxidoreductase subunit beta [Synergistes sp.]|nr:indolepyruvate oxidoreductase subunit beta [Synergistes sp.]